MMYLKKVKVPLVAALAVILSLFASTSTASAAIPANQSYRIAGVDATTTTVVMANDAYGGLQKVDAVVVASRETPYDALAAIPLAQAFKGPLYLNPGPGQPGGDRLDPRIKLDIAGVLKPGGWIILVGGTAALSQGVVDDCLAAQPTYRCGQFAGSDRYQTALQIANNINVGRTTVVYADGNDVYNAITASVMAARLNGIFLPINGNTVPASIAGYGGTVTKKYAIGPGAAAAIPGAQVISKPDYAETAGYVGLELDSLFGNRAVSIATGCNWRDALAGGAHAAARGSVLLYANAYGVGNECDSTLQASPLNASTRNFLTMIVKTRPRYVQMYFYGGIAALPQYLLDEARRLAQ